MKYEQIGNRYPKGEPVIRAVLQRQSRTKLFASWCGMQPGWSRLVKNSSFASSSYSSFFGPRIMAPLNVVRRHLVFVHFAHSTSSSKQSFRFETLPPIVPPRLSK